MAVELSKSRSYLSVLSKELEIRPELLYRWRRELEMKAETSFPGKVKYFLRRNRQKSTSLQNGTKEQAHNY